MADTEFKRPSPDTLLAKIKESDRPWLRVYIGAAPGVGKTYQMLEDAHEMRKRGTDVVIGFIETHGRAETEALIGDLEEPLLTLERQRIPPTINYTVPDPAIRTWSSVDTSARNAAWIAQASGSTRTAQPEELRSSSLAA